MRPDNAVGKKDWVEGGACVEASIDNGWKQPIGEDIIVDSLYCM